MNRPEHMFWNTNPTHGLRRANALWWIFSVLLQRAHCLHPALASAGTCAPKKSNLTGASR